MNYLSVAAMVVCIVMLFFESRVRGISLSYMLVDNARTDIYEDTSLFTARVEEYIEDTIRYVVIRDQFETDGQFDGEKEIDIRKYATHKEVSRYDNSSITYYLEDLIRWGQIGYSMTAITSREYYETYHNAQNMVGSDDSLVTNTDRSVIDYEPGGNVSVRQEQGGVGSYLVEESVEEENRENSVSREDGADGSADSSAYLMVETTEVPEADGEDEIYQVIYEEIYFPADGDFLILHTTSPKQYEEYSRHLISSIEMAYYNYEDYLNLSDKLADTNFLYYITYARNGVWKSFSNFTDQQYNVDIFEDDLGQMFVNAGKFIKCNYDNLTSQTNMDIQPEDVWGVMNNYYYAYPSNVRMWFGVDTSYLHSDVFRHDKENLFSSFNIYKRAFGFMVLFAILALGTLIALCITETADSARGKRLDKVKTEIAGGIGILLIVVLSVGFLILLKNYYDYVYPTSLFTMNAFSIFGVAFTAGYGLLLGMISQHFLLSLVRRLKRHTLYSNSLLRKLMEALSYTAYHPKAVIRTWIPYTLCMLVNVILVYLACNSRAGYLFPLVVFDLCVGVILLRNNQMKLKVMEGIEEIRKGNFDYKLNADEMTGDNRMLALAMNSIGDDVRNAVMSSMKDERMKVDLITNVSHDIKTPLTSIINYIDLIKRENIDNENVQSYIKVLDSKSQRLKQLTDDLVEASKISSGNISLNMQPLDFAEMVLQSEGEFDERFGERGLQPVISIPDEPVIILADSRRIWRVIENLYGNIVKYAMMNTRVYIDLTKAENEAVLAIKNISEQKLNIEAKELTERFIRGDISRSTEGSGLGLSIARSLTELQGGKFAIYLDGDLFKVMIKFPIDKLESNAYNSDIKETGTIETNSVEEKE